MKTSICLLLFPFALILIVSCAKEKPDTLTPRVQILESNLNNTAQFAEGLKTNILALSKLVDAVLHENQSFSANLEGLLRQAADNQRTNQQAKTPFKPISAAIYKNGIPLPVYNQISADAAVKWPGNYDMQAYEIDNQVAAYKKIHP